MPTRIVDVRQPREFAAGHIEGSELVPLSTLRDSCTSWDRSAAIELICKSGTRAGIARNQLQHLGFTRVSVLRGGVDAWRGEGKPLVQSRNSRTTQLPPLGGEVLLLSGLAVAATITLGKFVSPGFYEITAAVGGLIAVDALTAKGLITSVLAKMPWNRKPQPEAR